MSVLPHVGYHELCICSVMTEARIGQSFAAEGVPSRSLVQSQCVFGDLEAVDTLPVHQRKYAHIVQKLGFEAKHKVNFI